MRESSATSSLGDLVSRLRTGEIEFTEFGDGVLSISTRTNARDVLRSLPTEERTRFEWWFVARYGDRIPPRSQSVFIGSWNGDGPAPWERSPDETPDRVREAMHRAILAERESP